MSDHQKEIEEFGTDDDFWLFGYGSLIWKPPPHYGTSHRMFSSPKAAELAQINAYLDILKAMCGDSGSEDHRGTPEAPGRVVTLIDKEHWDTLTDHHESTERVWGAAYHIPSQHVSAVRSYLDIREINGYSIQFTPFHPAPSTSSKVESLPSPTTEMSNPFSGIIASTTTQITVSDPSPIRCLVYIGLPSNPQFLGPQDVEGLARRILESKGPSGENREYLYMLEEGLRGLSRESGDEHVSELARRCREIEAEEGA